MVPVHKPILQKGVQKCIRLQSALQPSTMAETLCASIMMRKLEELTKVHQKDRSTAVLSAWPRPDYEGDAHRATRAQSDEHVALPTWRCPPPSRKFRRIFRKCSKFVIVPLNSIIFFRALGSPHLRVRKCFKLQVLAVF